MVSVSKNENFMELDLLPYAKLAKTRNNTIWDPTRRKWLEKSPEEIVRQGLIQFFHKEKQIDFSKMRSEYQLKYNQLIKRLDLLVYDNSGSPLLLAECKSWKVKLNHNTLKQLGAYNSVIRAPYILACNGNWAILAEVDPDKGKTNVMNKWPVLKTANA